MSEPASAVFLQILEYTHTFIAGEEHRRGDLGITLWGRGMLPGYRMKGGSERPSPENVVKCVSSPLENLKIALKSSYNKTQGFNNVNKDYCNIRLNHYVTE